MRRVAQRGGLSHGVLSGNLSPGSYEVVNNLTFTYSFPEVLGDEAFDVDVVYADYFNTTNRNTSCNITFNSSSLSATTFNITNITLAADDYTYNLSCDDPALEPVSSAGNLTVEGTIIDYTAWRYETFNLTFRNASFDYGTCNTCDLIANASRYDFVDASDRCRVELTLDEVLYNSTIDCIDYDFNLSVTDARVFWDSGSVLGEFEAINENERWMIIDSSAFITAATINNSYDYFNSPNELSSIGKALDSEIFYTTIDLHNNGEIAEVIN